MEAARLTKVALARDSNNFRILGTQAPTPLFCLVFVDEKVHEGDLLVLRTNELPKVHPNSSQWKTYTCEYRFRGKLYGLEIPAQSWEEAEARLNAIAHGEVLGELQFVIKLGWIERIWQWVRGVLSI